MPINGTVVGGIAYMSERNCCSKYIKKKSFSDDEVLNIEQKHRDSYANKFIRRTASSCELAILCLWSEIYWKIILRYGGHIGISQYECVFEFV